MLNKPTATQTLSERTTGFGKEYQCLGLNVASLSGTLVGLLLSKEQLILPKLEAELGRSASGSYYQTRTLSRIIFEGVQPVRENRLRRLRKNY